MGESRTPRPKPFAGDQLRACPMICRRPPGRPSAGYRSVQSRVPRSGLLPDYATLVRSAAPLHDASTTRGAEVASTLTLPPKRRGRESTGGCQVLRFAACLTRPDGTSARVPRQPDPVESTHPHRTRTSVRYRNPTTGRRIRQRPTGCPFPTGRFGDGATRSHGMARTSVIARRICRLSRRDHARSSGTRHPW